MSWLRIVVGAVSYVFLSASIGVAAKKAMLYCPPYTMLLIRAVISSSQRRRGRMSPNYPARDVRRRSP